VLLPRDALGKILVYGAGVLGSLYAARLADSENDVTILARGQRLIDIRSNGIVLEDVATRRQTTHAQQRGWLQRDCPIARAWACLDRFPRGQAVLWMARSFAVVLSPNNQPHLVSWMEKLPFV
jgi:choline dehydrogenase-like flavoprotein